VPIYIELVGSLAAAITTLCWIPQIIKIVRHRQTDSISLVTNVSLALGVLLWLFYGMMISSWPVMAANGVTSCLFSQSSALSSAMAKNYPPGAFAISD